jgi:hypothetical protein
MRNNFKITFFTLLCFTLLFNITVVAQDTIPNVTKPKTSTVVTPTQVGENPTNNNNTNTVEIPNTEFPTPNPPKKNVFIEKPDPELIAAMSNNPFALVRDGKPKVSKPRKETLPGTSIPSTKSKKETVEKKAEEIEEIEEIVEEVYTPVDTSTIALNRQNPFRLEGTLAERKTGLATKKIKFNPEAGSGAKQTTSSTFKPLFDTSKVEVNPLSTLKFSLSIFLLGFLSVIVTRFRSEVNDIYKAFLNQNLMSILHREKGTILRLPYILLYTLTMFSVGTMLFLTTNLFGIKIFDSNLTSLAACIAGAGSIYLGRHFILSMLSYIFPFKKEINFYSFTIAIFNFIIGIVLLPFIIFIAFAPSNTHTIFLYIALFAVSIIYLFRIVRSLLITNNYLTSNKFHFFMYLCTVEIAPILILLKLVGL